MLYSNQVAIINELPDFRLIPVFLWGEEHSFDSEGDSYNPASRNWTWLHMHSRELANTFFEVEQSQDDSFLYIISSDNEVISNRVAYLLAIETNGKVRTRDGQFNLPDYLVDHLGNDFNLDFALERSYKSDFRKATLENPYPC